MSVATFECRVENGTIRLPEGIHLPDRKVVYVVVPESETKSDRAHAGFRLAAPADAAKFEMNVTWGDRVS